MDLASGRGPITNDCMQGDIRAPGSGNAERGDRGERFSRRDYKEPTTDRGARHRSGEEKKKTIRSTPRLQQTGDTKTKQLRARTPTEAERGEAQ